MSDNTTPTQPAAQPELAPQLGIVRALLAIAAEVPAVGKDDDNEQQHYKFRSIDAMMAALKPLLVKHGVLVYPVNILDEESGKGPKDNGFRIRQRIVYRFEHLDGSYRDAVVTGEGVDYGDKSCNKSMTASFKYVLGQMFFVPYYSDPDPDGQSPETGPPGQKNSQPPAQAAKAAAKPAAKTADKPLPVAALLARLAELNINGKEAVLKWMATNVGHRVEATKELKPAELEKLQKLADETQPAREAKK